MKIAARQLSGHLKATLAPVYLIAGDEPLLVAEALDAVRATARKSEFTERELQVVDRGFRWAELASHSDNLSLFASRRIVELRLNSARVGDAGSKSIRALVESNDPDRLILIGVYARIDATVGRQAWVKSIEKSGVRVDVWPIERGELPRWINERAKQYQVQLDRDAVEVLADHAEGNLLAADQELMKLSLTSAGSRLGAQAVLSSVSNNARFDVFRLADAVLAGNAERALRVLSGLRAEGTQPTLIAWALNREITTLAQVAFAVEAGAQPEAALRQNGVWPRRQPLVRGALRRLSRQQLTRLLRAAPQLDLAVKGSGIVAPWEAITAFVIDAVSGHEKLQKSA